MRLTNHTIETAKAHSFPRRFVALMLVLAIVFATGYAMPAEEEEPAEETPLETILSFFQPIRVSAADSVPSYVRVGLYYASSAQSSVTLGCAGGFFVGSGGTEGFTKSYGLESVPKITFTVQNGVIVGADENGVTVISDLGNGNCVWPASGGRVTVTADSTTRTYRGGVILRVSGSQLTVINLVSLEQYLYGVINAEMYHTNPIEALKAQAVAARSFACVAQNTHKSYGFDVCASSHCQVYRGVAGETTETTAAVDATKGQCIRYNGEIVRAYYSSNNGGWIMDIRDAWGSTSPYCVAKADPYTPVLPWSAMFTYDDLAMRLDAAGKSVGTVTSVAITGRTDYGYVTELTITGTDGTAVFSRSQILVGFASSLIKSQNFLLVDNTKEATLYTISEAETAEGEASAEPAIASQSGAVTVLNADGETAEVATTELSVQGDAQTVQLPTAAEETGVKAIALYGSGNGHSVGMSQDGAKEMARQGFSYDEILKFYYTGVEVY